MYGYLLNPPSTLPTAAWACKSRIDDYAWENNHEKNLIELCLSEAEERLVEIEGKPPIEIRGKALGCVIGDEKVKSSAPTGITVKISSIAVKFDTLEWTLTELDEAALSLTDKLILPVSMPTEGFGSEIERLFGEYVHSYTMDGAAAKMHSSSIFFELLYRLDAEARAALGERRKKHPSFYAAKATYEIERRYASPIGLSTLARELGITPSYLSTVFRSAYGKSFSDALFEIRINAARVLAETTSLRPSEISAQTGLGDESNLRRRFKARFGMSIREYRSVFREQTLLHEKPLRKG